MKVEGYSIILDDNRLFIALLNMMFYHINSDDSLSNQIVLLSASLLLTLGKHSMKFGGLTTRREF